MSNWLPIAEYSYKNRISVSTIRRKIKSNSLKHKIENGKYFIMDDVRGYDTDQNRVYLNPLDGNRDEKVTFSNVDELISFAERSISMISKLNKELVDQKDNIISMQEGTIRQLREQVAELKMLVSVLEKNSTIKPL